MQFSRVLCVCPLSCWEAAREGTVAEEVRSRGAEEGKTAEKCPALIV